MGADLIGAREPRIARYVGVQDRRELPLDGLVGHDYRPSSPAFLSPAIRSTFMANFDWVTISAGDVGVLGG